MIAKQIAAALHHELLVKPLDDINFMYDAAETVQMNYGLSLYCGITGGRRMLSSLNMDSYGIEHTGMIGDVVIGSFMKNESELSLQTPAGMYSNKLASKVTNEYHKQFEDHEQYLLYVRGIHGACSTHMIRTNYTATWSPFLNTDFFEFCLSISLELRCNHRIYKQWILTKYPEAAKFKLEKIGLRITAGKLRIVARKLITREPAKLARICKIPILQKGGMNLTDYWYHSNEKLRNYFEDIYFSTINMDILNVELRNNITRLYQTGSYMEKVQTITLLLALQLYFGETSEKNKAERAID